MRIVKNLLIVDDDPAIVRVFERIARDRGWSFATARSGEEALEQLNAEVFEAAVVDIKLPGFTGLQLLDHAKRSNIDTEMVIITGVGSVEAAVFAMKNGAYDYVTKPFDDVERVVIMLDKAMDRFRMSQKLRRLERRSEEEGSYEGLLGKNRKMQEVFDAIESIAPTTSTVLITGESGTGKELVARAIHTRSKRSHLPFVVINCAAIPIHLLESELFGHKRGSFTGAHSDKSGLFDEADRGTIFLDEIGEMPPAIQVKLLRVLQEGEVRPVGGVEARRVDVRVIAATNRDLAGLVHEGSFREDLFYRVNVISIPLPPLRERADDIPMLAFHFMRKYADRMKKRIERISVDALQALQGYSWTGNVRELENVIERAVVLAASDTITAQDLPAKLLSESFYQIQEELAVDMAGCNYQEAKRRAMAAFNKSYLTAVLREAAGNVSFAAEKAGMDRSNFKKLVRRYGIDTARYRGSDEPLPEPRDGG